MCATDDSWSHFSGFRGNADLVPLYHPTLSGFRDLPEHLTVKFTQQVNSRARHRQTPLVAALFKKHFRVAELVLEHDADINV